MWTALREPQQLAALTEDSNHAPQVIFKHSTRCSISRVALSRFDRDFESPVNASFFLLDLLQFRSISQSIAEQFDIVHESPQLLIIRDGKCVYHANHLEIEPSEILTHLNGG